jgi:hypothetical protein
MAEAGPLTPIIVIEPYNFEDIYIYNSICDYVKTGIKSISDTVVSRLICPKTAEETRKRKAKDEAGEENDEVFPKQYCINVTELQPRELAGSITGSIPVDNTIKRIDSGSFSEFLRVTDTTPLTTIKDLNRQVILQLQSLQLDCKYLTPFLFVFN